MRDMLFARKQVEQSRFELKGFALDLKRSLATHLSQVGASFDPWALPLAFIFRPTNQRFDRFAERHHEFIGCRGEARSMVSTVDNNPKQIVIDILDDGRGVPESMRRVFDPFYTTRADGSGLGLSVIAKVVHARKGSVEVRPESSRCQSSITPASRCARH